MQIGSFVSNLAGGAMGGEMDPWSHSILEEDTDKDPQRSSRDQRPPPLPPPGLLSSLRLQLAEEIGPIWG